MFRILTVAIALTIGAPAMGKPAEMPPSRLRMTEPSEDEVRAARPGGAEMEQMINSFIEGDGPETIVMVNGLADEWDATGAR